MCRQTLSARPSALSNESSDVGNTKAVTSLPSNDSGPSARLYRKVISFWATTPDALCHREFPLATCYWYEVVLPQYISLTFPSAAGFPPYPLLHFLSRRPLLDVRRMNYSPTATQPISISASTRARRRSPSPASNAYFRFSRDDWDSSQSQGWRSPLYRPASSASRSSGGYSSDLIFSMDPERSSSSGSSRHGSVEPVFLYDIPGESGAPSSPVSMPVCSRCSRQYYGYTPMQYRERSRRDGSLLCPPCSLRETWQQAQSRSPDDHFYESTGYHPQRHVQEHRSAPFRSWAQHQVSDPRSGRERVQSSLPHVIGRAFPSYRPPAPSQHPAQPFPPPSWIEPCALPHATPVIGSYRPRYQLPQLITQVQQRAAPASNISRPCTADSFGVSSSSRYTHHRRQ